LLHRLHLGTVDKKNNYSGTVVGYRVLGNGVWVAEIMMCCLRQPQYEKPSYLQTCKF